MKLGVVAGCAAVTFLVAAAPMLGGTGAACRVAQPCRHDGTIYRVTKVTASTSVTGNHGKSATTTQEFVTVAVALYNTRLTQHDVNADDLELHGSNGKTYGPSSRALTLNGDAKPKPMFFPPGFSQYMGPHHRAVVVLLYEAPAAAVHGATLEIGSAAPKAVVQLGL